MVKIEINGQTIQSKEGLMLIDVADDAGIPIPRFCYHKKLSVAANCRMCLVEVTGAPKSLPACATPVTDGMKVFTRSPKALAAQKAVMEFLLINHPLDCPICDQGGECELQDVSMLYGEDITRFQEGKRVVEDHDIGPLVQTDMTRCIHCTRCVRFGREVAGIMELGATGRGEHMEIGTFVEKAMVSELSGNVIDLCPVGALTSKPYRYTARAWELTATPSIAIHDGVGSHVYLHHKSGEIKRVVPKEADDLNEVWLSDRDRFSYTGLKQQRLTQPLRKHDGRWVAVDWETALTSISAELTAQTVNPALVGALVSPTTSLENLYLLKKILNAKGIQNIDHRLHQQDTSLDCAGVMPYLPLSLSELEHAKAIVLIGSNLRHEQPIINHRVRSASLAKAKIMVINPIDYDLNYRVHAKAIVSVQDMVAQVAKLALALAGNRTLSSTEQALLAGVQVDASAQKMVELLATSGQKVVILGQVAQSHPAFGRLLQLSSLVADWAGAQIAWLAEAGNSLGACLLGVRSCSGQGLSTQAMLQTSLSHLLLWNVDPQADILGVGSAKLAEQVIAFTSFDTPSLRAQADWLLPIAGYGEEAGTFVNTLGQAQTANAPLTLVGDAKAGWKVLRVLGNMMDVANCDYVNLAQVSVEATAGLAVAKAMNRAVLLSMPTQEMTKGQGLGRIAEVAIYAGDMLVRQAEPLSSHPQMINAQAVRVHSADVQSLGLSGSHLFVQDQLGQSHRVAFVADDRVAQGSVVLGIGVMAGVAGDWVVLTKEQV